ncbi:hypothetical protein [Streptomyces sp. NPDC005799]|uniref:hypothetical protein n=1 Tax=Streptomyces sp. NPDC005799 TaxID=3154678 RepID=UPI0034081514
MQEKNQKKGQRPWWRRVRRTCVITGAFMTATYWTLRAIQEGVELHRAVSPWH